MENDNNDVRANHEDMQELIRQKETAIQAKGRLIDNMAYQIRTLSNAVIGFSDLLLSENLSEELMEYVNEINRAGNGLSALVNEVLDWARLESGRLQVSHKEFELAGIIQKLEQIIASSTAEKGLSYEIQVDPDLPSHLVNDEDRLWKCLMSLLSNALKYTTQGFIRIRILPESMHGNPCIRIDITDSSIGMSAEQMDHLFEPAVRAEDANEEVFTMLHMGFTVTAGLPLTKQLIQLLGGTLRVSSEHNVGSTFSLILPTGLQEANVGKLGAWSAPLPVEKRQPAEQIHQSPCVLLVEDQQSNRMVISLMLETLGVLVDTAEDGLEGVSKAAGKKYDLILMDLKMPRMDGYQASQQIRQSQPQTPIVALSAKVLSEQENLRIISIFDAFLTKPVDSHKLSDTVRKYVVNDQTASLQTETASSRKTSEDDSEETITFEYGN